MPPSPHRPFVTIVMPALNEERYIAAAMASLMPEHDEGFDYEIIVADGNSVDATTRIVGLLGRGTPAIRVVANERMVQAAGVNKAARLADPRSDILIRADCHATYPAGFVATCVRALTQSGAASVVVPLRTVGAGCMQRAVAAAQNSRLGNGGSAHRLSGGASGFVDHGHHAAFDRRAFLDLGGYDETFACNEDAEFDRRLVESGRRIWLAQEAAVAYFPRASLWSLARQYAGYGAGRARTVHTRRTRLKLRQMLPVAVFLACALSMIAAPADPRFLAVDILYGAICLAWGCWLAAIARSPCLVLSGLAAITMHLAWGFGYIRSRLLLSGADGRSPGRRLAPAGTGRER